MQLDGIGLFVNNMQIMAEFYRDILGFELEWKPGDKNVYSIKGNHLSGNECKDGWKCL